MTDNSVAQTFWAVFFGAFAAFVAFAIWRAAATREDVSRGEGLVDIAREIGGAVYTMASYPRPFVVFMADGVLSFVHQWMIYSQGHDVVTALESRIGFPGFLEATSRASRRGPTLSPRFRSLSSVEEFEIVTTDAGWAEQILKEGLRDLLRTLRTENRRARLTLAADRVSIEVETRLHEDDAQAMVGVLKRLAALSRTATLSVGVTILGEVSVADHGRCPVCRQAVAPPAIPCPACRAPHHQDCWEYWGRCAIFGCRGAMATSASRG